MEIEFFLRLHGIWEGIISLPPPPDPPFDIETMEPLDVPIHWSWSDQTDPPPEDWWQDTPGEWEAPELPLDDGYTLVLDGDAPTNSQTFPRSRWADGASFRVAKNSFQGKLPHSCIRNPDFSTETPTFQSSPVDPRLTALTSACFHGRISP